MTLSLDLRDLQALELFPLIFAYNYFSTKLAQAVRAGDVADVPTLHGQQEALRRELERRGVMGMFLKLKGLEMQELLEQADEAKGEPDERSLN